MISSISSLSGSAWSALNQADFANPDLAPLRITKVMYHPAELSAAEQAAGFTSAEDFEFIELRNVGASPLSLAGLKFVDGISFTFNSGMLAAGEHYSTIQVSTGASATTISRVSKSLNYGADGYARVLGKLAEGEDRA